MMRIAFLSNGESIHDRRFLSKMVEYGHDPILISYFGEKLVEVEGVKVYKYNYRRLYGFNRYITPFLGFQFTKKVFSFQIAHHLRKLLKEIKADILHTNFIHYEGFCGALTGFKPTISMPWGSDILINPETSLYYKLTAKFTLKMADMIVCDCDLVKRKIIELTNYPDQKIITVFCGVNQKIFNTSVSGEEIKERLGVRGKKIILMNRSLKPVYGIEYFIEALPIIIGKAPNVYTILIGDGPTKSDCQLRVKKLGLENHVYFAGSINENEMAKYLNAADIYVSTSLSDGTSVSLIEAMACGLPVIVSDIYGNRDWVRDNYNGLLTEIKNPESIGSAIIKLLNDPDKMKLFGDRNRKIAKERADWDKEFEKLDKVYIQLLEAKS